MRIVIDGHMIGSNDAGNETYISNLIKGLAKIDPNNSYTVLATAPALCQTLFGGCANFKTRAVSANPFFRIPWQIANQLRRNPADLLHMTYITPPLFSSCLTVVSVHDIIYAIMPELFSVRDRLILSSLVPYSIRRAAKVITLSENSRRDILRRYKLSPDKVVVIHLAAAERFRPASTTRIEQIRQKYKTSPNFILAVGNLQKRKNLERLVEAFARIKKSHKLPHKLVLVGRQQAGGYEAVVAAMRNWKVEQHLIFTGYVPDNDLPALYSAASLFVYPSLYQGFGLSLVEAMACGVPVITSNNSCLPEVAGDAALLVDPYDTTAIAEAILKVLLDKDTQQTLRDKGLKQAASFSWTETARKTLAVYEEITGFSL